MIYRSMTAFWPLTEASGNRADAMGLYDLTDVGTVGSTTDATHGVVALLSNATHQYLENTSGPWAFGSLGLSIAVLGWTYYGGQDDGSTDSLFFIGGLGTSLDRTFILDNASGGRLIGVNSGGTTTVNSGLGAIPTNTWLPFLIYWKEVGEEYGLRLGAGSLQTASSPGTTPTTYSPTVLRIGSGRVSAQAMDGRAMTTMVLMGETDAAPDAAISAWDWWSAQRRTFAEVQAFTG